MNVEKTRKTYTDKYLHNFLGYSFHALMVKEDKIVGCNTVIPQEFILFDKKYSFGQWCETFIQKINNESFKRGRYFDDKDYKILAKDEYEVVYKKEISKKHNGAKIIWIIDVSPLDKLSLEKAVNELKKIDQDVDLIIYIGYV